MKQLTLLLILLLTTGFTHAQKTAFVNEGKLLKATPGYEQATKEMDSLKKVFATELKAEQEKLQQKFSKLVEPYKFSAEITQEQIVAKLSEADKKKLELLQEEGQLQGKQAKAKEEEYQLLYNQKVGSILEKVNTAVKTYCTQNKIEILYKLDVLQQALAYYNEKNDITEEIIKRVK